ncbi:DUF2142 domain-containing protein [Microbacterium sp. X-17]|uniref:DUF2142 domain-containing protein n=1 Tax=Microbacterium sp. X-17 TaxID=3144404 RepID=UPI0031F5C958
MTHRRPVGIAAAIAVPVLLLVALLSWAFASPVGASPDDPYHMASIWCAAGPADGVCETTADPQVRLVPREIIDAACYAGDDTHAATCPKDPGLAETSKGNWNGGAYPPVYYFVMHAFVSGDLSASVIAIRVFNAALYVGVLTALLFLLPLARRPALVWGAAITLVPLGMFLVPSINPSSWAVLSASGVWIAAWGFLEQRGWRRAALGALTVLLVVIGAGARSDAAAFSAFALILAAVLAFRRDRRYLLGLILPGTLIIVAAAFFLSGGQSAVVGASTVVQNSSYDLPLLAFLDIKALPQLIAGAFGVWGLGWLDTSMPGIVWVSALAVFTAVAFWGLRRGGARKWIAVAASAASVVGMPLFLLLHDGVEVGHGVQPRYVYPLIVIFAGIVVVGFTRASLGLGRVQLVVLGVGAVIANAVALQVNLRRYVTGVDVLGPNLDRDIEWWWNLPVSPMGVWAIGAAAFALFAAVLVWLVWNRSSPTAEDGAEGGPVAVSPAEVVLAERSDAPGGARGAL